MPDSIAKVMFIKGGVVVDGETETIERCRDLPDCSLKLEPKSSILIAFNSGMTQRLTAADEPVVVLISKDGAAETKGVNIRMAGTIPQSALKSLPKYTRAASSNARSFVPPGPAVTPIDKSATLTSTPTIAWNAAPNIAEYKIEVYKLRRRVFKSTTTEPTIQVSTELDHDTDYNWKVFDAETGNEIAVFEPHASQPNNPTHVKSFKVASADKISEGLALNSLADSTNEPGILLFIGESLKSNSFHESAIRVFEKLIKLEPDNPDVMPPLYELYCKSGALEKADELKIAAKKLDIRLGEPDTNEK